MSEIETVHAGSGTLESPIACTQEEVDDAWKRGYSVGYYIGYNKGYESGAGAVGNG